MMQTYALPAHVYACFTADAAVILDVRKDKYIGLSEQQALALYHVVKGWPEPPSIHTNLDFDRHDVDELATTLVNEDLLEPGSISDVTASRTRVPEVVNCLYNDFTARPPHISPGHCLNLLCAIAWGRYSMRRRTLEHIINRVQTRRDKYVHRPDAVDLDEMLELARIFLYLRPFFYSWTGLCLLDSLILLEFMSAYNLFPHCVFGVRTAPFSAHAWVQTGDWALNATVEVTRRFVPILSA